MQGHTHWLTWRGGGMSRGLSGRSRSSSSRGGGSSSGGGSGRGSQCSRCTCPTYPAPVPCDIEDVHTEITVQMLSRLTNSLGNEGAGSNPMLSITVPIVLGR